MPVDEKKLHDLAKSLQRDFDEYRDIVHGVYMPVVYAAVKYVKKREKDSLTSIGAYIELRDVVMRLLERGK